MTVQAGVSLDPLMRALLPFGLWVPVLPGTRQVTIGGAIAADVHGKNHHTQGSFGNHVRSLDLLMRRRRGAHRDAGRRRPRQLFWATIGGMGLTGVILGATVAVQRTETAYFTVDTDRCGDIDELMATDEPSATRATRYSVAWFDAVTRGRHMGRAVLTRGNKARLAELPPKLRRDPLKFVAPSLGTIPEVFPNRMVNKATGQGVQRVLVPQGAEAPGRRAAEHHPVLPPARHRRGVEPGLRPARLPAVPVRRAVRAQAEIVPAVLRDDRELGPPVLPQRAQALRAGQPVAAVLPDAGLDSDRRPADRARAGPALRRARRRRSSRAGGRVYLAKDSRLSAATFRRMYPRLEDFLAVRRRVDPDGPVQLRPCPPAATCRRQQP